MRHQGDSSDTFPSRLKLKEGVSHSPLEQRITTLEQKLSELASVSRYQIDSVDVSPLRMKRQEGVSHSPIEQRMVMLERKVSELSKIISGLVVQLAEVSSAVRDIKKSSTQVKEDVELQVKTRGAQKGGKAEKKGKAEYIIAESDYPIEETRKSRGNVVVADKD